MRTLINQQALDLLELYNIPVLNYTVVNSPRDLSSNSQPFFLKVDSPSIIHKSDRRGVHKIYHKDHAKKSFYKLRKHGTVIRQPMVDGHEFVIQLINQPRSNKSLILGFGGVSTDVHNDFSLRVCPLKPSAARDMITELKTFHYFSKFNGKETRFDILEDLLLKISHMSKKEKVKSLEIDPFILNNKAGRVIDAKIVLD